MGTLTYASIARLLNGLQARATRSPRPGTSSCTRSSDCFSARRNSTARRTVATIKGPEDGRHQHDDGRRQEECGDEGCLVVRGERRSIVPDAMPCGPRICHHQYDERRIQHGRDDGAHEPRQRYLPSHGAVLLSGDDDARVARSSLASVGRRRRQRPPRAWGGSPVRAPTERMSECPSSSCS